MNKRTLVGIWKANRPLAVWAISPLLFSAIVFASNGRAPEWGTLALFLVTLGVLYSIAEFSNTYADRDEDRLYMPGNPLVTGELSAETARKAFIGQNVLEAALLSSLFAVTLDYHLALVLAAGWVVGIAYSLPPLKLKESVLGPFAIALGDAILVIASWLVVAPLSSFAWAFAALLFTYALGVGVALKFRKTFHALKAGLIEPGQLGVYNLDIVDLGIRVKTALVLEAVAILAAFVLAAVFWHAGIFDAPLSIGVLTLPLACAILAIALRVKDPVGNGPRCVLLMGVGGAFMLLVFFVWAVVDVLQWHWGYVVLSCLGFVFVALVLLGTIKPFGHKGVATAWRLMWRSRTGRAGS